MTRPVPAFRVGQAVVATSHAMGLTPGHAYTVYGVRTYESAFGFSWSYVLTGADGGVGETQSSEHEPDHLRALACVDCDHEIDGVDVDDFREETGNAEGAPARCFGCQEKWDHEHRTVRA